MSVEFVGGNQVRLLESGDAYFPALEMAIEQAQQEIYLETYIFADDSTGIRIAAALSRAARRGVAVQVLVDGFGSHEFPQTLGDAGWPDHIRKVAVDAVEGEVRHAPAKSFYLVLTHQHDLDLRITEAILQRGDFGFLGLIGSKTKKQRFIHRFQERGIAAERIARISCPIGIEGITGKEPEIIAVSVVAQLLRHHR